MPHIEHTTDEGGRVAALGALYQAQRQDMSAMYAQSIVPLGLAIGYTSALGVVVTSDDVNLSATIVGWVPLPLWAIVSMYLIIQIALFAHDHGLAIIETALVRDTGLLRRADEIGSQAGRVFLNPKEILPLVSKLLSGRESQIARICAISMQLVFASIIIAILIWFNILCLLSAFQRTSTDGDRVLSFWTPAILYSLFLVLSAIAVYYPFSGKLSADLPKTSRFDPLEDAAQMIDSRHRLSAHKDREETEYCLARVSIGTSSSTGVLKIPVHGEHDEVVIKLREAGAEFPPVGQAASYVELSPEQWSRPGILEAWIGYDWRSPQSSSGSLPSNGGADRDNCDHNHDGAEL